MTSDIQSNAVLFKTIAQLPLCGTAKLIALAIETTNTLDVAELMEMTGETRRVVQLYRAQYLAVRETRESCETGFAKDAKVAKDISHDAKNVSPSPARVEDNNIITLPVVRVVSEVKCSEDSVRANQKPKRERAGTYLPEDWILPDDWRQWTRTNYPQSTADSVENLANEFRDYWIAMPGQRGRKSNWLATWRNRCRMVFATAPIRPRSQPPPSPSNDRNALAQRMLAMLDTEARAS